MSLVGKVRHNIISVYSTALGIMELAANDADQQVAYRQETQRQNYQIKSC